MEEFCYDEDESVCIMDTDDEQSLRTLNFFSSWDAKHESFIVSQSHVSSGSKRTQCGENSEFVPRKRVKLEEVEQPSLPDDIVYRIFQLLRPLPDLLRASSVCKAWLQLSDHPSLWTTVSFNGFEHVSDANLYFLFKNTERLQKLRSISLSRCHGIAEFSLLNLFSSSIIISGLEAVDLSWCSGVTDRVLLSLSRLEKLSNISISRCFQLTRAGIETFLGSCKQLTSFDASYCEGLASGSVRLIADRFSDLVTLRLCNSYRITDGAADLLARSCRHLKVLDLSWCRRLGNASANSIALNLPNLRELRFVSV